MTTRRDILKSGAGLAAILASGKAPAYLVKSMIAARNSISMRVGGAKLPYDAEVEYLESTKTQCIDTEWHPSSNNLRLLLDVMSTGNNGNRAISGSEITGITCRWLFVLYNQSNGSSTYPLIGNWNNGAGSGKSFDFSSGIRLSLDWTATSTNTTITNILDGSSFSHDFNVDFTTHTSSLKLFQNTDSQKSSIRLFSCKIYDNGILVRDFIPVRFTNEQGVSEGAVYDRVSKKLFRNQGTGAFLYGRDINPISARSYVNDGLIAMWDGIENSGWGVHDQNATWLKNLVSDGVLDVSLNGSYKITDNSVRFSGGYGIADKYDFTGLTGATISVLAAYKSTGSFNANGWSYAGGANRLAAYFENTKWTLSFNGYTSSISDTLTIDTIYKYDFIWHTQNNSLTVLLYKDGILVDTKTTTIASVLGNMANHFRMMAYGSSSDGTYQTSNGEVFNCMVYGKALTAAEIAANYAVDKERFNLA